MAASYFEVRTANGTLAHLPLTRPFVDWLLGPDGTANLRELLYAECPSPARAELKNRDLRDEGKA